MTLNQTRAAPGAPWTPEYLAFVLDLAPEQVLKPATGADTGATPKSRTEWRWIQTAQRLVDCHGAAEALVRLNGYGG